MNIFTHFPGVGGIHVTSWAANLAKRFARDERGVLPVVVAISMIPLISMIGLGTDAARGFLVKSHLATAVDAAALAAAKLAGSDDVRAEAIRFIEANFSNNKLAAHLGSIDVNYDEATDVVTVTAAAALDTSFLRMLHIDQIDVGARAVAKRESQLMELAMVLDVTGSMSGSKLTTLKTSAKDLIDIIYAGDPQGEKVNVALVPFSARVNVGTHYRNWLSTSPSSSWRGCMETRDGSYGLDATLPSRAEFDPTEPITYTRWVYTWSGWQQREYTENIPCPTMVTPLSNDQTSLRYKIDALEAGGTTRTDIGLAWGWRAVSGDWQGQWQGAPALPSPDNDAEVLKAIVLMTDGQNVPRYSDLTTAQADERLADICENVKAAGITLFTITFQAPTSLDSLYERCASSSSHFFRSPDRDSLQLAFRTIGNQLASLRLTE